MLSNLSAYLQALTEVQTPPFSLENIPDFPYDEYQKRLSIYQEADSWYTGEVLEEVRSKGGTDYEIYPVKINPLIGAVQKHTFALFGEVGEDDRPLVSPKIVFHDKKQQKLAEEAEEALFQVWFESNGRAIQWQNGAMSQVYGGCIFKATYDPFDKLRQLPIRIEGVHPKYFVGRPSADDMFRLREAWFIKPISQQEARENGYTGDFASTFDIPWLIEHWTDAIYEAWVNDQPVRRFADQWYEVSGPNPFGFVPSIYIPHIRVTGFYGENMFDHVKGVIKELNLRVADFGDAVSADAHAYLGMRNVQGAPTVLALAPGLNAVNVGNSIGFAGSETVPDLWDLRKERASESMQILTESLYNEFRRGAFIPKVADGEDEGSQRSGLTLAMRMLSLLWHTQSERVFWTAGLNLLNRMILRMLMIKSPESGIGVQHAALRQKQDWSPVLPRDREMLINEVVARMGANISSPETLFNILGDIQDSDAEKKGIIEFMKQIAEAQAVQQPQVGGEGGPKKKPKPINQGMTTVSSSEKSESNPKSTDTEKE